MKVLISITTANRSLAVKSFAWDYIAYCKSNKKYDFLISLDGDDKKTLEFCKKNKIPILYSEQREGVGLSKNRVLSTYATYDHYFFIEDDVGLINTNVFELYIKVAQELGIHHMSLFPKERVGGQTKEITLNDGLSVICAEFGGAPFNYFTKVGIDRVGGFHTCFAQYRRFGHTEHSYRFVHAKLAEYPFYLIADCFNGYLSWNDPVSVTKINVTTVNRLFVEEYELIKQKLKHFQLMTLSQFSVPDSLDLSHTKKPILNSIYRLLFNTNMAALSIYRKLKKLRRIDSGR